MPKCIDCEERKDSDDIVIDELCSECADNNNYFVCTDCDEWSSDEGSNLYNDKHYCRDCFDCLDIGYCSGCDEWMDSDNLLDCNGTTRCEGCAGSRGWVRCRNCNDPTNATLSDGHDEYCEVCFDELFFFCAECEEVYTNDDGVYTDDGVMCADCAPCTDDGDYQPDFTYMKENNYTKLGSNRRYGIELESSFCPNYTNLNRSGWGAKYDASVTGKEFYSAIFRGDKGLDSIRAVCEFAADNRWKVDDQCGYHLHLNMRYETPDQLKAIAYAYHASRKLWCTFVAEHRLGGNYSCSIPQDMDRVEELNSVEDWRCYSLHRNRNIWVNWCAYRQYKSLEIRLHAGTFDADMICNWIRAHTTFVDWASDIGYEAVKDTVKDTMSLCDRKGLLTDIWNHAGCDDLAEFYGIRELVSV